MHCNRKYTPEPKQQGYPASIRKKAAEMYGDGGNLRRIARHLKIAPRTVALLFTDEKEELPNAPLFFYFHDTATTEIYTGLASMLAKK